MGAERHRQESLDRQATCWKLRVEKGYTQERIAAELNISQQAVSALLVKIEKRLFAEFAARAEAVKALQTARLDHIYCEAMTQWERSCQDAEQVKVVTGRAVSSPLGVLALPDLETRTVEGQTGNPALLSAAMKALADVRDIWGLNAASRTELTGPNQGPVRITEVRVEMLTAEVHQKLARLAGETGEAEPTQ